MGRRRRNFERRGRNSSLDPRVGDPQCGRMMTPRPDIVALPTNCERARSAGCDMSRSIHACRLSRSNRQRRGFIYVRELLQCWRMARNRSQSPLSATSVFCPETKPLPTCWKKCRRHTGISRWSLMNTWRGRPANSRGYSGEIVGEIEDGNRWRGSRDRSRQRGVYEVLGSTEIGKIERLFDMEIEADDFTTSPVSSNESVRCRVPVSTSPFVAWK